MGRPSKYSQELAFLICERISEGESLRSICSTPDMPCKAIIFKWLSDKPEFLDQYARAREEQAESMADEIVAIADSVEASDNVAVQKARLQIDARKWVASKLKPKRYGDRLDLSSSDRTMSPPGVIEIVPKGTG
jgi:hypothetical protein